MSKITYADKVALNSNAGIPDANKVKDTDMNDIKGAINQIGAYNIATAGSNGDFNVTLKGTLTIGDIVTIKFPSATNPASNARLSIDGGVSYVNIFSTGSQIIASRVQNKYLELTYDGTNFILPVGISRRKLLWSGDIASGSITLTENIYNFSLCIVRLTGQGTYMVVPILDDYNFFRNGGMTCFSNTLEIFACFAVIDTPTTMTLTRARKFSIPNASGTTITMDDMNFAEIWGVNN